MTDPVSVEVTVEIAAQPKTVFSFFSDPERLRLWMGEGSVLEGRKGGNVVVSGPGGPPARGTILEWVENERIVFSWTSPGISADEGSRVTVTLAPSPGGTVVSLRHTGIPSEEARRGHAAGWRHFLAALSARAAAGQTAGRLDGIVDASLEAWSERDPAKRAALLDSAWSDDPVFRDPFASVRGREALDAHIASVQGMAPPGGRIFRAGPVEQCHGHIRFSWRAEGSDGAAFARGTNFGDLTADGRLARIVGFWE